MLTLSCSCCGLSTVY